MKNVSGKSLTWLLSLILLLLGRGTPSQEQADLNPNPVTAPSCLIQPRNWDLLRQNLINPVPQTTQSWWHIPV
jgi:hypothetical protein